MIAMSVAETSSSGMWVLHQIHCYAPNFEKVDILVSACPNVCMYVCMYVFMFEILS